MAQGMGRRRGDDRGERTRQHEECKDARLTRGKWERGWALPLWRCEVSLSCPVSVHFGLTGSCLPSAPCGPRVSASGLQLVCCLSRSRTTMRSSGALALARARASLQQALVRPGGMGGRRQAAVGAVASLRRADRSMNAIQMQPHARAAVRPLHTSARSLLQPSSPSLTHPTPSLPAGAAVWIDERPDKPHLSFRKRNAVKSNIVLMGPPGKHAAQRIRSPHTQRASAGAAEPTPNVQV
jgi:hypothetical protein